MIKTRGRNFPNYSPPPRAWMARNPSTNCTYLEDDAFECGPSQVRLQGIDDALCVLLHKFTDAVELRLAPSNVVGLVRVIGLADGGNEAGDG